MATTAQTRGQIPYVGLNYYTEEDADVFFGRDVERGIVTANLRASRLTLLYAGSGVGKSSLIRAGVAARLGRDARRRRERGATAYVPVVFSSWRDNPAEELISAIETTIEPLIDGAPPALPRDSLEAAIEAATKALAGTLLIILDQFEEYFLYKDREAESGRLARQLARCVGRTDLRANFLVAVREDAYAGVGDLFKGRIDNVYGNFLHLEYLNPRAARDAIEKPIERYNELHPEAQAEIEPELVDEVLRQVRAGQHFLEQSGQGRVSTSNGQPELDEQIETPYLQLVMTTLWEAERENGHHLRLKTFVEDLGGAQRIVGNHLDDALADFSDDERATAVDVFQCLVTPSGTKIAYPIDDLVKVTGRPTELVQRVIDELTGERRILKPIPGPPGEEDKPRVEIFHDVLAPAILDWRTRQEAERLRQASARAEHERDAAEEAARRERRRARAFGGLAIIAIALLVVAAIAVVLAVRARRNADTQTRVAQSELLSSQAMSAGDLQTAAILAIGAYRLSPTVDARSAILATAESRSLNVELGPDPNAETLAFSPDGKMLASVDDDGTTRLWDVRTHRQLRELRATTGVDAIAFSPDGRLLASGDSSGLRVWDVSSGRQRWKEAIRHGGVTSVAFADHGRTLVVGGNDNTVRFVDVGAHRQSGPGLRGAGSVVAVSADGRTVASAVFSQPTPPGVRLPRGSSTRVQLWDVRSHRLLVVLHGAPLNGEFGSGLAFSPDDEEVAAGGSPVQVWHLSGRHSRPTKIPGAGAAENLAFTPDGESLVTASFDDGAIRFWDVASWRQTSKLAAPDVRAIALPDDGRVLASAGAGILPGGDSLIHLWSLKSGRSVGPPLDAGTQGQFVDVSFGNSGRTMEAASGDGTVRVWDLGSRRELATIGTAHPVPSDYEQPNIRFSSDGNTVALASAFYPFARPFKQLMIQLLDLKTHRRTSVPHIDRMFGVVDLALTSDGGILAVDGEGGEVTLWNVAAHRRLSQLRRSTASFTGVAFSPDGRVLAAGTDRGTIWLWDVVNHRWRGRLAGHTDRVQALAFSADGKTLASGSDDKTVRLWDLVTRRQLGAPLYGHTQIVAAVAFSPDGKTLASGGADNTVRVWDVASHRQLGLPLTGATNLVYGVAFSPDGRMIASGSADGSVRLWTNNPTNYYIRQLCADIAPQAAPTIWHQAAPTIPFQQPC